MQEIPPFMVGQLVLLPGSISFIALFVLFFIGISEVRHGYIGKPGIVANSFFGRPSTRVGALSLQDTSST
jgi:hypothetical protein